MIGRSRPSLRFFHDAVCASDLRINLPAMRKAMSKLTRKVRSLPFVPKVAQIIQWFHSQKRVVVPRFPQPSECHREGLVHG